MSTKTPASVLEVVAAAAVTRQQRLEALLAADEQAQAELEAALEARAIVEAAALTGDVAAGALTVAQEAEELAELRVRRTSADVAGAGREGLAEEAVAIATYLTVVDPGRQQKVTELLEVVRSTVAELGAVAEAVNADHVAAGGRFLEIQRSGTTLPAGTYIEPSGRLSAAGGQAMLLVDAVAKVVDVIQDAVPASQRHAAVVFG